MAMNSNKRKAPDDVVVRTGQSIHREIPKSDRSFARDSYYANLYTKEVDFKSLSEQDAKFAAMHVSQQPQLAQSEDD